MNAVTELIDKMEDVLRTHGWIQNYDGSPEVGYCIVGALTAASTPLEGAVRADAYHLIADVAKNKCGVSSVPYYNDEVAESVEDVFLLLKEAKTLAEATT